MGFSRVNVWVHDIQEPCKISEQTWRINVTDCQNRVIRYCGRTYANIPARCGHTQFSLPPGCYIIWGAMSVAIRPPFLHANYITHFAFVQVSCHDTACVQLYAPTYKKCWRSFFLATHLIARLKGFPQVPGKDIKRFLEIGNRLANTGADAAGDDEFDTQVEALPAVLEEEPEPEEEKEE